ncbi:Holliday junction resolvase RuvX [Mycoplasmopsis felifaucium]|uniref:Holliday junction resolvase RuvX n=1 Tax=Mycoplasmopsis felifaucium TaxID=35768 RepID=UPI000487123B|nr:Holliday junction resolvase RuvX [Mycoplasmopsis felifaucium]
MRKLALDLGTKTCGFAISDIFEIIPNGLETIKFEENDFQKVIDKIKLIIKEYQNSIDGFVLGYPLRSNGAKSERTAMVEDFARMLHNQFPDQNIYFTDEYGSTMKAERTLKDGGNLSSKKTRQLKDKLSAVIILSDYLNYGGKKYVDE